VAARQQKIRALIKNQIVFCLRLFFGQVFFNCAFLKQKKNNNNKGGFKVEKNKIKVKEDRRKTKTQNQRQM